MIWLSAACRNTWVRRPPALRLPLRADHVLVAQRSRGVLLTGSDRSFIAPMLLAVVMATLVTRIREPRSIYDARLTGEQVAARRKLREPATY